jgi:hypothetical protein
MLVDCTFAAPSNVHDFDLLAVIGRRVLVMLGCERHVESEEVEQVK